MDELEFKDDAQVTVVPIKEPSLAHPDTDPFAKFKKNPEKFHYRAINTRPHNLRKKEASGYQTVGGSEFGDLVLAKIPKDIYEQRDKVKLQKAANVGKSIKDSFVDQTNRYAKDGLRAEE